MSVCASAADGRGSGQPAVEDLLIASTLAGDVGLPLMVGKLAGLLASQGRRVRAVGPSAGEPCQALAIPGVTTTELLPCDGVTGVARAMGECRRLIRLAAASGPGQRIIHIHGIWTPPVVAAGLQAIRSGLPFVVSPHGMLLAPALQRHWVRKRVALALAVRRILQSARLVHAASDAEAEAVRRVAPRAKTVTIPFGVELPGPRATAPGPRPKTMGYLGRLAAGKNLELFVRAWAAERPAGWRLCIAGPDEAGLRARLERMAASLGLHEAISIEGPVPRHDVGRFLTGLAVFVQPSVSENFGLAVAEALASATPVITTTGTPWAGVSLHGCGWYVPPTEAALRGAIAEAVGSPLDSLAAMGARGAEWMAAEYSWAAIAPRFLGELYGLPAAGGCG